MKKFILLSTLVLSAYYAIAQKQPLTGAGAYAGRELSGEEADKIWQGASFVWVKQDNIIPSFIEFRDGYEPDEAAFFAIARKLFRLPAVYGFNLIRSEMDDIGWQHKRFQLTVDNVPVKGGILILHMRDGKVKKYNGYLFKNVPAGQRPGISETTALNYAFREINAQTYIWEVPGENDALKQSTGDPNATYFPKGELEIYQVGENESDIFKLAWKFRIYATDPLSHNDVFVDAQTGEILGKQSRLYHVNTPGTAVTAYRGARAITADSYSGQYRLYETTRGNGIHTWNMRKGTSYNAAVEFLDADNNWNNVNANLDQYAGDAHWGAEMTYDFYKTLGRNSIDNSGYALNLYVHYNTNYFNAFWDTRRMTFGDAYSPYKPLTSLDITGHEISHGLTDYTADLRYLNESGALNESFSDILGAAVEWFADSTTGNWTIGEDIGSTFRSMSNPNSTDAPDTYNGNYWYSGTADNGGVHTNSGVQNFWYYLLSQGGSGTNDIGNTYNVTGITRHKATRIAWRNLVYYLSTNSTYNDARTYAIQSAADLYGNCSPEVANTTRAWYAVGVGANYVSGVQPQFTGSPLSACTAPAVVTFTNTTSNGSTYKWYFGDGTTSTATNPVHMYNTTGLYTVKLVVDGGACGKDSITKTSYVNISTSNACAITLPASGIYQTQTACNGTVYDNGGPNSNYGDLTNSVTTISPAGAARVRLHFTQFRMENGYDFLYVYDGPNTSSPVIRTLTGTTIPADITSTGSSITIRQASDNYVTDVGFKVEWSCILPTTPPVANFAADVTNTCTGNVQFSDLSTGGATSWLWNFGDGNTSTLQNPYHQYATNGTFTVSLKATNAYGNNTATKTSYITITKPAAPVANDISNCASGSFSLSTSGPNHVTWFDSSGAVVSTQNPFTTPNISTTTTYWVEDSVPQPVYTVGAKDSTISTSGIYFNNPASAILALRFSVNKKCKLVSVFVYAKSAGYRTIQYRDAAGGVIQQKTVNCPEGGSRITLNFDLLPGGPYELGLKDTMNLFRNQGGAVWPYTDANGMVSITGNNTALLGGTPAPSNYYYFYDWYVKENDCISQRKPVTVTIGSGLNLSVTPVNPTCFGGSNGTASIAVSGGTPQYKYNWSNGQTTASATNLAAGSVTVTVTDATGCSSTTTKTVSQPAALSPVATGGNVSCNGGANGSITLAVSGGTPTYTYNWGGGVTTKDRSGLAAGTYTVTITDANSCTTTGSKTITQPTAISPTATSTNPLCNGGSNGTINLTVTGGTGNYTYNWGGGVTTQNRTGLSAGTYSATITDVNNCTASTSKTIAQPAAILPTATTTNALCNGASNGTINLTVTGGTGNYTYNWGGGVTTQNRTGLSAGTYSATITDANNCTATTSNTVSEPTVIQPVLTKTDSKCGLLTGKATAGATGGNGGYKYLWNNNATTATISNLQAGNYFVTITDVNNCSAFGSVIVNDSLGLVVNATSSDVLCFGNADGSASVNVSSGTAPYQYQWNNGSTSNSIGNLPAGNYYITITDADQCRGIQSFSINQPPAISIAMDITQPTCNTPNSGAARVIVSGGFSGYSFAWSNQVKVDSVTNLSPGTYSVVVKDANGCETDTSFTIINSPQVSVVSTTKDILCFGRQNGNATVSANGGTAPYIYRWNTGSESDTLRNLAAGTYTVTVTDQEDCSGTATVEIRQPAQFYITTSSSDATGGRNNGTASVTNLYGGVPPFTFNWSTGDTSQTINNLAPGSYVVTALDDNGCVQVGTVTVHMSTGLNHVTGSITFSVYPNPANNDAVLEISDIDTKTTYTLKNILGQALISQPVNSNKTTIHLSSLAAGIYILEVQAGERKGTKQLVVVRQ